MTKEKEALDSLGDIDFVHIYDDDKVRRIIDTIESALLKETPQKAILKNNSYHCPACGSPMLPAPSYCEECGQSLSWG